MLASASMTTDPYVPAPLDTTAVELPPSLLALAEKLAENVHDIWARQRFADGWTLGPKRDDGLKTHPCLIPYGQLPEEEKEYDRQVSVQTLKAILVLGSRIAGPEE